MSNDAMGQVVSFARTPAYLQKLGTRLHHEGKWIRAVEILRVALEKAPDDVQIRFELAKVYSEMYCPSLSNQILFSLFTEKTAAQENIKKTGQEEPQIDSFLYAARNFAMMHKNELAKDCLSVYAAQKAYGLHNLEAGLLFGDRETQEKELKGRQAYIHRRIERAAVFLGEGKIELAYRQIRRAMKLDPQNGNTYEVLTYILLSIEDYQGAYKAAKNMVRYVGEDISSLCTMALTLSSIGLRQEGKEHLLRASDMVEDHEDIQLVAQIAAEMQEHQHAAAMMKKLENDTPYSDRLLHLRAVACYHAGEIQEAKRCWNLLLRIDPMDSVAKYYAQQAEKEKPMEEVFYGRLLPFAEVSRRLSLLSQWVQQGVAGLQKKWDEEIEFEYILRWGLWCDDIEIARAVMGIARALKGKRIEHILRLLLCDALVASEIKQQALVALHAAGIAWPIYVVMQDRLSLIYTETPKEAKVHRARTLHNAAVNLFPYLRAFPREKLIALCVIAEDMDTEENIASLCKYIAAAACAIEDKGRMVLQKGKNHRKDKRFVLRLIREYKKNELY